MASNLWSLKCTCPLKCKQKHKPGYHKRTNNTLKTKKTADWSISLLSIHRMITMTLVENTMAVKTDSFELGDSRWERPGFYWRKYWVTICPSPEFWPHESDSSLVTLCSVATTLVLMFINTKSRASAASSLLIYLNNWKYCMLCRAYPYYQR